MPTVQIEPVFEYVALYEVVDVDRIPEAAGLLPELAGVTKAEQFISPAIDSPNMRAYILEQIFETDEPTELPAGRASLAD